MTNPEPSLVFHLYFPDVYFDASANNPYLELSRACSIFWEGGPGRQSLSTMQRCAVRLDFSLLSEELQELLLLKPEVTIGCLSYAAHLQVFQDSMEEKIRVRIHNLPEPTRFTMLKASSVGKFVALQGTVVRVSNIRPMVLHMEFACAKCNCRQVVDFKDGLFTTPARCANGRCTGQKFEANRSTAITYDWQRIKVQEVNDATDQGRIPRSIEVELTDDLCDCVLPGDSVVVCGLVKAGGTKEKRRKGTGASGTTFLLYLSASSCVKSKGMDEFQAGGDGSEDWTAVEVRSIQAIARQADPFKAVVNSICPAIYGHELVKAGMVLVLFGGSQWPNDPSSAARPDSHMLVVGDPGMGKSQMLRAAARISPRGVYVCGNTTTSSGLTVTVVRDQATGDYVLEAGALVLADRGVCCIDEFDKISAAYSCLLETMEQQRISIAKAGIVCNLPARTSVLAAANPTWGHYNRAKTVAENLKLPAALLSRFDLIYILLDTVDRERDRMLSHHVMRLHSAGKPTDERQVLKRELGALDCSGCLASKLRVRDSEDFTEIPPQLLRRYIAYAKQHVQPELSAPAAEALQEFYLHLRKQYQSGDCTPITTRQLEALIRLSQARARAALRDVVVRGDAEDVIELMKDSLYDVLRDETGALDVGRSTGMSAKNQKVAFLNAIANHMRTKSEPLMSLRELKDLAASLKLKFRTPVEDVVDSLNEQGSLLRKGSGMYAMGR
eukprot:GGOE01014403.1.p1 GENE.GGOE01014403.1~~GGOE01014403.1.p1  ORF type:complete len:781 (-),score=217.80 GGOE01014403.1:89-2266(-)